MNQYIKPALIANASTLGIHWIYDHEFLKRLSQKKSLLFLVQDKKRYEEAEVAFYSYPNHKVGDVTVQGEIVKWLYEEMKINPDFTRKEYDQLLYDHFKSGGLYHGYVESYALKNVMNRLENQFDIVHEKETLNDDHLVGFMPYLVCKELQLDTKKAWDLAQVYTTNEDYYHFYLMFDEILKNINILGLKESVKDAIEKAPASYKEKLIKAIEMDDTEMFIEYYSGRACSISQSIPLIIHLLYHEKSYEQAILKNAMIGGAISDRNILLGAVFAQVSDIPQSWIDQCHFDL